jgi:hypothetical protein
MERNQFDIAYSDLFRRVKMSRRSKKTQNKLADVQDFVIVSIVDDFEQAKDRETLLRNNDIPAMVKQQDEEQGGSSGWAVMVPEEYLDEAHVVVESQDAYDDFYDFAVEDDEDDEFGGDFFDDEF